jgi:hypothetical protein
MPLRCQQELHTEGFLGVPTGKNPEDSNLASVGSRSGSSSTYPSVMIGATENTSHCTAKMCRNTIMHSSSHNSEIVSGNLLIWTFLSYADLLVHKVCPHFSVTLCIQTHTRESSPHQLDDRAASGGSALLFIARKKGKAIPVRGRGGP